MKRFTNIFITLLLLLILSNNNYAQANLISKKFKINKEGADVNYKVKNNNLIINYNFKNATQFSLITKKKLNLNTWKDLVLKYKNPYPANILQIIFKDNNGTLFGKEINLKSGKSFNEKMIDLSDLEYFNGDDFSLDYDKVKSIQITLIKDKNKKGTLTISKLQFKGKIKKADISSSTPASKKTDLNKLPWYIEAHTDGKTKAKIKLNTMLAGQKCDAVIYNFAKGEWFQLIKNVELNINNLNTFSFDYINTNPSENRLAIRITDTDGSFFGVRANIKYKPNKWQSVKINLNNLSYNWGGDTILDKENINRIYIIIEKINGGKGKIGIKNLSFQKLAEMDNVEEDEISKKKAKITLKRFTEVLYDQGAFAKLVMPKGKDFVYINYNLSKGNWVQFKRSLDLSKINLSKYKKMKFKYILTTNNDSEGFNIKFAAKDWSFYMQIIKKVKKNSNEWETIVLNLRDFKYAWGKNKDLKLSNICNVFFCIDNPGSSKGKLFIKDLEFYR